VRTANVVTTVVPTIKPRFTEAFVIRNWLSDVLIFLAKRGGALSKTD
jgi:hypothetical protein